MLITLFDAIRIFFTSIFFPSSPENQRRVKLKELYAKLNELSFPVMTKDGAVTPEFARVLYELYVVLLTVKTTLDQTIASKDARVSSGFQDLLIEKAISPEQAKEKSSFDFLQRETDLRSAINSDLAVVKKRIQDQTSLFNAFVREFRTPAIDNAEAVIKKVFAFYDLCCFDYYSFFLHFNKSLTGGAERLKTVDTESFTSVFVDDILPSLLDLNFLFQNLEIDTELLNAIQMIYKQVVGNSEDKFLFISKQLSDASDIINKRLGKNTILYMIRIAKGEPEFRDATPEVDFSPVKDYLERLEIRFEAGSKRLFAFHQEAQISNMITETFGTGKLFSFSGYNDEINKKLYNLTMLSFDWVRPMELLRTFTKRFFEQSMKGFLKNLLVEGLFQDKKKQQNLSSAYYYCEGLSHKFEEFDNLFLASSKYSLETIQGYLKEIENGANFEQHLEKIVVFLNYEAKTIVQQAFAQYTNLYNNCNMIISDSKQPTPELVGNMRFFTTSQKTKNLFNEFDKSVVVLKKFLEIMKNYAIINIRDNQEGG